MTNPIGTKEQRDRLRHETRLVNLYIPGAVKENLAFALDGLDIAEKAMRAQWVIDKITGFKGSYDTRGLRLKEWNHWLEVAFHFRSEACAEWKAWKGGTR
jgi:hypothetical protein